MAMNQHRYQYLYLPLQRHIERMSGRGQLVVLLGKVLIISALVILALLRSNLI